MSTSPERVFAGGAVCWKVVDGEVRILLVHRTQHKDVSLPKGKVDPGETLPETAQREILEETGLHVTLGAYLGRIDYLLPAGRPKEVHYWAAEVDPGEAERTAFESNDEICALEWLSVKKARKILTYEHDADIVENFNSLYETGTARTFPVILVRHGKAVPSEHWDGPDSTRPLLQKGLLQAQNIAGGLLAFGPELIVSSPATRCVATMEPLRVKGGVLLKISESISQDEYQSRGAKASAAMEKRISKRIPAVMCSHGPVFPQLVSAAARTGHGKKGQRELAEGLGVGSFSVIHFSRETETPHIVAVETHEAPRSNI
jgi:8-oxo-dGTP pyrophosphatase MutT (NUDIX family)/phosphohistidine phosphatase SixA